MTSFSKERKCTESPLENNGFSFHGIPANDSPAGTVSLAPAPAGDRYLTFQLWKVRNKVAVNQSKTVMRLGAETGEAAIGSVAAVEAAMAAEVAETLMTESSPAVVAATTVVATVAAAAVAAVQAR